MIIVKAILKSKLLDGIEVMTVPIGTEYFIDLNSKITLDWFNKDVNYGKKIEAVVDVMNGGYLPFELLEIKL